MADRYRKHRGVKRLAEGLYLVTARTTDERTGKEKKKRARVQGTIEDAVARRNEIAAELLADTTPERVPRLRDYAAEWLERRAPMLRASTLDRYTSAIAHLSADLGDYYLDRLRPADVERFQARHARRRAPATVNGWVRVMGQVCRAASRDHGVTDPTSGVRALREARTGGRRGRALTLEEFRLFLSTLHAITGRKRGQVREDAARALEVLAWTGMRRGELFALRWADHRGGELHITRSVWRGNVSGTKTDEPRIVPVVEPCADVLQAQRDWLLREQHPGLKSGLVFPSKRKGRAYHGGTWLSKALEKVVDAEDELPTISVHSLRRSYENLLRAAGVGDLVRRSMAGWRSDRAQEIYATVAAEERAAAGAAVVRLVGGEP